MMLPAIRLLGSFLVHVECWLLWGCLLATIGAVWWNRSALAETWAGIHRTAWLGLAVIVPVAAFLRLNPENWEHNVFDDEYVHARLAHTISYRHRLGWITYTHGVKAPVWPPGYHFISGACLRVTGGYSEAAAFRFNAIVGTFCVGAAFLLVYALFSSSFAAGAGAAFVAVWPLHVRLSNGASTEILAHLFLMLYGISLAIHRRRRTVATAFLTCQLGTWTALMRPELFLIAPVTALAVVWSSRGRWGERPPFSGPALAACLLPLGLPVAHAVFSFTHYHPQRAALEGHCLGPALLYWIRPGLNNPLLTVLAAAGIISCLRTRRTRLLAALLGLWIGYVLLVAVYRRTDPNVGDLQRYFILGGTAFLLLAARFLGDLWRRRRAAAALILGITLAVSLALLPLARQPMSIMAQSRRAQAEWLNAMRQHVPDGAVVFSDCSSFVWAVTGWRSSPFDKINDYIGRGADYDQGPALIIYRGFNLIPGVQDGLLRRTGPISRPLTGGSIAPVQTWRETPLSEGTVMGARIGLYRIDILSEEVPQDHSQQLEPSQPPPPPQR